MNISLRQISITISILSLCVLFYDFFVSNVYDIEPSPMVGISALLFFNIFRLFYDNLNTWVHILLYVSILFVGLLSFYMLLLFSFGFGFKGQSTPWNHIFAVILHISLMIVTIVEFQRSISKK